MSKYPEPPVRTSGDPLLSIGVFARRSRLSAKALRLYDRLGVLTPADVDEVSGYRRYRESQLAAARTVAMLRRLDMPLALVAQVISAPPDQRSALVAAYWHGVERRHAEGRSLVDHVRAVLSGDERSYDMFTIELRKLPEQLVLTEQRHTSIEGLSDYIGSALGRLQRRAPGAAGGNTGPFVVIYHGEVNEDSDGPVEVCVPIESADQAPDGTATRVEPAHQEAYVRLTRAQMEFPQVLSAYDAVTAWVGAQGRTCTGAPREVYFTDFTAAKPDEECCDVAFPVA